MTDKEVMQMALDALDDGCGKYTDEYRKLIEALRTALAQPEPEPWGYISHKWWMQPVFFEANDLQAANLPHNNPNYTPVYKAPPKKEWVGLTKEEIAEISEFHFHGAFSGRDVYEDIETRLKEKNT